MSQDLKVVTKTSTAIFNLVLATVGVGAYMLPYNFAQVGLLQSLVLLSVFFFASIYSLTIVDVTCQNVAAGRRVTPNTTFVAVGRRVTTFASLVATVLGRQGAYAYEVFMLLYSFGLCVSYVGVIGTEVANAASRLFDANLPNDYAVMISAVCFVLPLASLPESILQHAGAAGAICMAIGSAFVVYNAPWSSTAPWFFETCASDDRDTRPVLWVFSIHAFLNTVPIFAFCNNSAVAFVSIRAGLVPPSQVRTVLMSDAGGEDLQIQQSIRRLIWFALSIVLVYYVVTGTAGYLTFCGSAIENVLNAYPAGDLFGLMARMCLALQLALACASLYLPLARTALTHLVAGIDVEIAKGCAARLHDAMLLTAVIAVATILDGALDLPLSLTSSVCVTAIMFVFPGLCANAVVLPGEGTLARIAPLAFAVIGVAIGFSSTFSLLSIAAEGGH
eukprot:TRINITY_DN6454_c0_g1_i3.p1 TRINITY_DN6454_c0_g1~~TRINITY_DN6454_c0_g1_i3.p1  ORF type:complete len:447 (-),score=50.51 TRINITY_DN6454_c0_g1_i3:230-1570(-)